MTSILPPMLHSSTAPSSLDTAATMSEKKSGFSSVPCTVQLSAPDPRHAWQEGLQLQHSMGLLSHMTWDSAVPTDLE